jgi:hypothetical protein
MSSAIIEKVRKLLRLAESPNANEAAAAAAKAQELIDQHNLSAALLALDAGAAEPDEEIEDFTHKGAPLDDQPILHRWRSYLASTIARANSCRIYMRGGEIALVGRPSDAETVRYLFGYLAREVDRLCDQDGKGCGRTWRNNYRLGVVDTIARKLREQRDKFEAEQRKLAAASGSTALVRVNQALVRVEQRGGDVERWMKKNLKLYARSGSSVRFNSSAREAGRAAGRSIAINRSRGALGA